MNNDTKFFGIVAVGAIAVIIAIIFFSKGGSSTQTADVTAADAYKKGPDSAPVKIVAFEDFQCPACKAAEPAVRQMLKDYDGKVQFAFRQFPLPVHPNAEAAAMTAEAAGVQGKFWEMKELLYDTQDSWASLSNPDNYFGELAKQLGLDLDKFKSDYRSDSFKKKIKASVDSGVSAGIDQTPTFIVNGKKITGAKSSDQWKQIIEEAQSQPAQ